MTLAVGSYNLRRGRPEGRNAVEDTFTRGPVRVPCPECGEPVLFPPMLSNLPAGTTMSCDCLRCGARVVASPPVQPPAPRVGRAVIIGILIVVFVGLVIWAVRLLR